MLGSYYTSAVGMAEFLWPAAVIFALLAIATKREKIFQAVLRARREFVTNLGLTLIYSVIIGPLFVVPTNAVHQALPTPDALVEFWRSQPEWLALIGALFTVEFTAYWRHRLEHHPLVWPIHATHHADEAIHWLTVFRKHPLAKILAGVVDVTVSLMLGLPPFMIGVAMLLRTWWGFFIHADVNWTLGPIGEVMISPAAHRLHHIRDEQLMGSNYSNTFTLFDRMFGTYVDPKPYLGCEVGIAEGTRGFFGELWRPFESRYWTRKRLQAGRPEEELPKVTPPA